MAEFVDEDYVEPGPSIGNCAGCGEPIFSGTGVVVDATSDRWHSACRAEALQPAPAAAKRKVPA